MPNWFYYDNNGQKQGPITGGQLKGLAKAGYITPETKVENEEGKSALAKKVQGLTFMTAVQSQPAPPPKSQTVQPAPAITPATAQPAAVPPAATPPAESDPWDWGIPASEVTSLVTQSQAPNTAQSPFPTSTATAAPRRQSSGPSVGSQVLDLITNIFATKTGRYLAGVAIVLVIYSIYWLTTASLEGKWVRTEGTGSVFAESIELFKDGTGTLDGNPITWKKESERVGRRSYHYYLHFNNNRGQRLTTAQYKIFGSTLTLEFADGKDKYKKQQGGTAAVQGNDGQETNPVVNMQDARSNPTPYLERRANFKTQLTKTGKSPQEWENDPLPRGIEKVKYPSGGFQLDATLYIPQGKREQKNPALVFFHGGFANGNEEILCCEDFMKAGYVVMGPTLRAENGGPGNFELFLGEVDDAANAVRWLAQQPYVDSERIYTFGHSVGGGISALLSLIDNVPVKHGGSSGGLYPPIVFQEWKGEGITPFNPSHAKEAEMRLLLGNIRWMKRPHYAYIGTTDNFFEVSIALANAEMKNENINNMLFIRRIPGDHFTSFEPAMRNYLTMVQQDNRSGAIPNRQNVQSPDANAKAAMSDAANKLIVIFRESSQQVMAIPSPKESQFVASNVDLYIEQMKNITETYKTKVDAINLAGCSDEFKVAFAAWKQACTDENEASTELMVIWRSLPVPDRTAALQKKGEEVQRLAQLTYEKGTQFSSMCRKLGLDVPAAARPVENPQARQPSTSPTVRPTPGSPARMAARGPMQILKMDLDRYNRDVGQYPTTQQGLAALLSRPSDVSNSKMTMPYVQERQLSDPWGNPYRYARPGKNSRPFDIWSVGPDGVDGTADDVGHWMELRDL